MYSTVSAASRINLRTIAVLFTLLVLFGGSAGLQAQSLRFSAVLYGIDSVNGTQANNVNALNGPNAVAVDALGDLFIIDRGHEQIRKVDPTGTAALYAGKGVYGYTGDNGQAVNATFGNPTAIGTDPNGNLYVADTGNYAIRRIDATTGIVTTIAGGNGTGYTGDGSAAVNAKLQAPASIAFDSNGNLYFSDGAVVRRVDTTGIITTFAGGGTPSTGNGDGGAATAAKLVSPVGLAVDASNNLYIVDSSSYNVRVVNTTNNIITTFAGTGVRANTGDGGPATAATFLNPLAVAADTAGNIYISDAYGYIRLVNSSGIISTLAGTASGSTLLGDGTLPTQSTFAPAGAAVDTAGNFYFAVTSTNKVYKIVTHPERFPMTQVGLSSPSQRIIIQNAGLADIAYTSLTLPGDFSVTAINPYLASTTQCSTTAGSHTISAGFTNYCTLDIIFTPTAAGIRSFPITVVSNDTPTTLTENLTSTGMASTLSTTGGNIFTIGGNYPATGVYGDGGQATASSLVQPDGLVTDSAGNIYFSEYGYCRIRKIDATTGILTTIAGINPTTCTQNAAYNQPDGPAATAELYLPSAIAIDSNGTLYIGDGGHDQIRTISGGFIKRIAGTGAGGCTFTGDGGSALLAQFCNASGIAVDKAGNVYFTDSGANMIRKITASTGIISILAGTFNSTFAPGYSADGLGTSMTLNRPWGLALDSTQTNLIFVENGNYIVRKLNLATGMVTTIAGSHTLYGYSGDGGLATAATLQNPYGLYVDTANNIFIADSGNNVIRKIDGTTGIITTVAGNFVQGNLYNGDGIAATSAGLYFPENVTVDAAGNLILSDRNPLIREVSPNGSLNFGNQLVSTTSASQTVSISNIGNTPMTFSTPPYGVSGDFAFVSGGTCTFTTPLTPGSSCTVKVNFTPTATGSRYGLLAYYNSGVGSPQLTQLRGVGTAPAQPVGQTIGTFPNPGNKTYGSSTFGVTASSTSGLPVTVTVQSGPATITNGIVTLTGVGTVVLVANQAGNTFYLAAPPVTVSFTVAPATLTVTPANVSIGYGVAIPTSFATLITGYVNNDTSSVVSGTPAVTTTAVAGSPVASYPITATIGTLAAANYTFTFVPGTLTIGQGSQRISFGAGSLTHLYGDVPFSVTATSDSGLSVTLAIQSGPGTLSNGLVTITGIGHIIVLATQPGNTNYTAATPTTLNITVTPAVLTVTAQPATMVYASSTLPTFTGAITGYVYSDTASVVSGTATYSTTATSASVPGGYPIAPVISGLSATNYTFTTVSGTLTVTPAPLTITPNAATRLYGVANPNFTGTVATLKNGDNPTVTYSTTATSTSPVAAYPITATLTGTAAANYTPTIAPANLTITQAGTTTSLGVSASQVNVLSPLTLTATVTPATTGTPTGTVTFLDNGTTSTTLGTASFVAGVGYTLTLSTLPGGVHSITARYSGDTNFTASTSTATTVTVGDYTFSASPSSLNITDGSTGTTTITLTPTFGWSGTQTPICLGLKTGETCTFLPATITVTGNNAPTMTVLSIGTTPPRAVAGISAGRFGWSWISLATLLMLLPACIAVRRKRVYGVMLFLLLAMATIMQTGCGGGVLATNPNATPTGPGTLSISFAGADTAHQLNLTVTVN